MNQTQAIISVSFFLLISSCNYFKVDQTQPLNRFIPEVYFKNEALELNSQKKSLEKTILKEGVSETIRIDSADWLAELKPFININITKPAQINSYEIDSIFDSGYLTVNYIARDSTVNVKQINIVFKNEKLQKFRAVLSASNLYYHSIDTLEYYTRGNYRISAMSKPKLGKEVAFELNGKAIE